MVRLVASGINTAGGLGWKLALVASRVNALGEHPLDGLRHLLLDGLGDFRAATVLTFQPRVRTGRGETLRSVRDVFVALDLLRTADAPSLTGLGNVRIRALVAGAHGR